LKAAGRIDYHPVFPDRPGSAARRIATDADIAEGRRLLSSWPLQLVFLPLHD
jgi:hypothetical protein